MIFQKQRKKIYKQEKKIIIIDTIAHKTEETRESAQKNRGVCAAISHLINPCGCGDSGTR